MTDFLNPRAIALVGATERSLWSAALITNFRTLGYTGSLHLVHPRERRQFDLPCYPALDEVPGEVDHAYVLTGTEAALDVVEACGRRGVREVTMLTAGFRETGARGAELEAALVARCRELGLRLQGPNCLGFVNYLDKVPAYGLVLAPPLNSGGVALLSQSGAMLLHFHRLSLNRGVGLAYTVSVGNEAMLSQADYIDMLLDRPEVKVVGALMEGVRQPRRFLEVTDRALAVGKPIVVLKVGHGEVTARAVAAHTGSLAGADEVVEQAFRQHGVVRVRGLEELFETCALLAEEGWPSGGRTAVITTSGGASGLIADLAFGTNVALPDFNPDVKARLSESLPNFGTPQNPLDTTGVIVDQPGLLGACINAVASSGEYDAIVINSDLPREPGPNPERLQDRMAGLAHAVRSIPTFSVLLSSVAVDPTEYGRETAARWGLHFHAGLELGVRALDHAIFYGRARDRSKARPEAPMAGRAFPPLAAGWSGSVPEVDAKRLLEAYGIGIPPEWLALDEEEAARAAAEVGFPVVVKLMSPDLVHKSDFGGVRLGLTSPDEVRRAVAGILESTRRLRPEARVRGLLVARQVAPVVELIAGVKVDPLFGPVVVAGLGGVFVETLRDVSLRLPPIDRADALEMLDELRGAALLRGIRGRPPADREAAAKVLVSLGELALDLGARLRALEVNPLLVLEEGAGALAADAVLVLE